MKPPVFEYVRAESLEHAVETIGALGEDAKFIAGGQSLVPLMAVRLAWPSHLVDISGITELSGILVAHGGALTIGASTVQRTVERSAEVAAACPLLPEDSRMRCPARSGSSGCMPLSTASVLTLMPLRRAIVHSESPGAG